VLFFFFIFLLVFFFFFYLFFVLCFVSLLSFGPAHRLKEYKRGSSFGSSSRLPRMPFFTELIAEGKSHDSRRLD